MPHLHHTAQHIHNDIPHDEATEHALTWLEPAVNDIFFDYAVDALATQDLQERNTEHDPKKSTLFGSGTGGTRKYT